MKLKSFIAGAAGVLLFVAGQNLGAEEGLLAAPDQNASALPAPNTDATLPPPDPADTLPPPAVSSSASPAQAFRFPWPAGGSGGGSTGGSGARAGSGGGSTGGSRARAGSGGGSTGGSGAQAGSGGGQRTASVRPSAPGSGGAAPAAGAAASRPWPGSLPPTGTYLGAMAGLSSAKYNTDDTDWDTISGASIGGRSGGDLGLFLGLDFGLLIGEVGALFSFDNAETTINYNETAIKGMSLHVPLLLKMDFHLGPVVFQPLAGPYFNLALGKLDMEDSGKDPYANPPFGLAFGGLAGLNLGRGFFFIDGRYEMDLGKTVGGNNAITLWRRSAFILNFGYQIYLGRR